MFQKGSPKGGATGFLSMGKSASEAGSAGIPSEPPKHLHSQFQSARVLAGIYQVTTAEISTPTLSRPHRAISFTVFLISGLTLFLLQVFAFNRNNRLFQSCVFVGLPVVFSLVTYLLYQSRSLNAYWQVFFSYSTEAIALTLMWLFDDLPTKCLHLDSKKPAGMALGKVTDAVILICTVIVLARLFRISLGSIYLQKGRLRLGLIFGIVGFAVMATFGVLEAQSLGISLERIRAWIPSLLVFCLANGVMEELFARGLFLKKFEPFLGRFLSNLVTAIVFAAGHVGVTYSSDLLTFL